MTLKLRHVAASLLSVGGFACAVWWFNTPAGDAFAAVTLVGVALFAWAVG